MGLHLHIEKLPFSLSTLMETATVASRAQLLFPPKSPCLMTSPLSSKLPQPSLLRLAFTRLFATTISAAVAAPEIVTVPKPSKPNPSPNGSRRKDKKVNFDAEQLKLNWLDSISSPLPDSSKEVGNADAGWVIGIDPDLSGALAVLKPDDSSQVYDSPHLKVAVGGRLRKRLDTKSIIQLIQSIDAPIGTTVYIEQSIPFPQDGKQGWWSGGFGYGLWIGILVASGYSVIPVPSLLWKNEFKLAGNRSSKDDSRELASTLFPSVSSLLKRKKDHGRAEALLIAAYGKGIKLDPHSSRILEDLTP